MDEELMKTIEKMLDERDERLMKELRTVDNQNEPQDTEERQELEVNSALIRILEESQKMNRLFATKLTPNIEDPESVLSNFLKEI